MSCRLFVINDPNGLQENSMSLYDGEYSDKSLFVERDSLNLVLLNLIRGPI